MSDSKKEKNLIVKSNYLIEASYRLSIQEQRLLLLLISMIKPEDKDFHSYKIQIKEFNKLVGIQDEASYTKIRALTKNIRERTIVIKDPHKDTELQTGWLSSAEYFNRKGYVELCFDPKLKPYLLELKEFFTQYQLKNVIRLKRSYSIRLYELLKQYEKIRERKFELEELKRVLGIRPDEYKLYGHFKSKVLEPAKKELRKGTDISFNYKENKHGRKVVEIIFLIQSNLGKSVEEDDQRPTETTNLDLHNRLKTYFRLSTSQVQWALNEYNKNPERVLTNLSYVETRYKKGEIKSIGPYTLKAIRENYSDQPSMFDVGKGKNEVERKAKQAAQDVQDAQERHEIDFMSYLREKAEEARKTLPEAKVKAIEALSKEVLEKKHGVNYIGLKTFISREITKNLALEVGALAFEDWINRPID